MESLPFETSIKGEILFPASSLSLFLILKRGLAYSPETSVNVYETISAMSRKLYSSGKSNPT
jgi:hypothetical protein